MNQRKVDVLKSQILHHLMKEGLTTRHDANLRVTMINNDKQVGNFVFECEEYIYKGIFHYKMGIYSTGDNLNPKSKNFRTNERGTSSMSLVTYKLTNVFILDDNELFEELERLRKENYDG